jgi:hypothetical protein
MLRENLKDAAIIIDNILTQPLSIAGIPEEVSLLSAAERFAGEEASHSELRLILLSFLDYPGPTKNLVIELDLLSQDLLRK